MCEWVLVIKARFCLSPGDIGSNQLSPALLTATVGETPINAVVSSLICPRPAPEPALSPDHFPALSVILPSPAVLYAAGLWHDLSEPTEIRLSISRKSDS